jgi:formate--tetrahydrofolate ligase
VLATSTALGLADYVVTEAGFGADLGAEKFFDIKCRKAGLQPACVVVVATLRALKMHGGVSLKQLGHDNPDAVQAGAANLIRHVENMRKFGLPVVVAINSFTSDTPAELAAAIAACGKIGVQAIPCRHWAEGGAGALDLAEAVTRLAGGDDQFKLLYEDSMPLAGKITRIATEIYGAAAVTFTDEAARQLTKFEAEGFGALPICMAKTQYSFSADPAQKGGAPTGFTLPVREVRLAAGAEFIVALCGNILTMPGLPRHPAATDIFLSPDGEIWGLD